MVSLNMTVMTPQLCLLQMCFPSMKLLGASSETEPPFGCVKMCTPSVSSVPTDSQGDRADANSDSDCDCTMLKRLQCSPGAGRDDTKCEQATLHFVIASFIMIEIACLKLVVCSTRNCSCVQSKGLPHKEISARRSALGILLHFNWLHVNVYS